MMRPRFSVAPLFGALTVAAIVLCASVAASSASAAAAIPWWHLDVNSRPATLAAGASTTIVVRASNLGTASTSGPLAISLSLPAGVSVTEELGLPQVSLFPFPLFTGRTDLGPIGSIGRPLGLCSITARRVSCANKSEANPFFPELDVKPYEYIELRVKVTDVAAVPGAEYEAEVSGGEAATVSRKRPLPIGKPAAAFGAEEYSLVPEEADGSLDTRAGSHPFQLTTSFALNQSADPARPPALARNLSFKLPPGQIGNATAIPQCSTLDFTKATAGGIEDLCPPDTAIGAVLVTIDEPINLGVVTYPVPLFNLTPAVGEPARFGFTVVRAPVFLDTAVRSGAGEDYGVTVSTSNISQLANFISSTVTFWGTPGDPSHDQSRGWACLVGGFYEGGGGRGLPCEPQRQERPPAFLTLPTDCAAPFATTVEGTSWTDPGHPVADTFAAFPYTLQEASRQPAGLTGCNQLAFSPTISAEATTDSASSPSGLDFNLNFDDEGLANNAEGLAQSQMKDTTVTLPEGFTINPSAGVGLGGCTAADYGRESVSSVPGAGCPNDSKLGTVEIETPLLTQKIQGSIFIAQPYENPSGSLVGLYVVAKNPETGVLIKLAGKVTPDPLTGQLTTTFENNPELPFDHFNFHFREGQQAPLVSPPTCGTYTTAATLQPWSDPTSALTQTSALTITKGAEGGPCPSGAPPFQPQLQAGTLNNNAGTFSPVDVRISRTDAEQEITSFSTDLPPGLTGDLSGIPFCPEPSIELARTKTGAQEEASPSCPASSQVGHTLVGTGVGAVLAYVPGKIYLGGPYHGDPFSIVSVTSAVVGPFDLGTVVLRFALRIDPSTAQVSVDPSASEPIPHILKGIVTHVRDIRVYIDRQGFTLNPTSCDPMSVSSALGSDRGQSVTISSPFQAASCANLKFAPKFAVSTSGKTSRANGASLTVKLAYPKGPAGTYANIARVKVDLPKQLPSRLTTLQKACTSAQFRADPAGCPAASVVGHAKAITPLIPVPLEGPAYFVSNGGEAFPNLIVVLQGYGVRIDLVGDTFISKTGITSSTFKTVPDQPIGSFELTLPEGKYSALAANGNLCTSKLAMPTEFLAQNGAKINQSTKISVTGCAKSKTLSRAQKLAKALKACKRGARAKQHGCEQRARRRYAKSAAVPPTRLVTRVRAK